MAATVSIGSIYSIYRLYKELNVWDKSTNRSVTSRFFARTPRIRRIVRIWDVVIPTKAILVFPKNFINFRFTAVKLQSIVNAMGVRVILR